MGGGGGGGQYCGGEELGKRGMGRGGAVLWW